MSPKPKMKDDQHWQTRKRKRLEWDTRCDEEVEKLTGGYSAYRILTIFIDWLQTILDFHDESEERVDAIITLHLQLGINMLTDASETCITHRVAASPSIKIRQFGRTDKSVRKKVLVNCRLNPYFFEAISDAVAYHAKLNVCVMHQVVFQRSVSRSMRLGGARSGGEDDESEEKWEMESVWSAEASLEQKETLLLFATLISRPQVLQSRRMAA